MGNCTQYTIPVKEMLAFDETQMPQRTQDNSSKIHAPGHSTLIDNSVAAEHEPFPATTTRRGSPSHHNYNHYDHHHHHHHHYHHHYHCHRNCGPCKRMLTTAFTQRQRLRWRRWPLRPPPSHPRIFSNQLDHHRCPDCCCCYRYRRGRSRRRRAKNDTKRHG